MPALSSGIFGYPVDEVANVLIQAALDFIKAHTSTTMSDASNTSVDDSKSSSSTQPKLNLKDICFTNFDSQTVNAFVTALNTTFKDITVNGTLPPYVIISYEYISMYIPYLLSLWSAIYSIYLLNNAPLLSDCPVHHRFSTLFCYLVCLIIYITPSLYHLFHLAYITAG